MFILVLCSFVYFYILGSVAFQAMNIQKTFYHTVKYIFRLQAKERQEDI